MGTNGSPKDQNYAHGYPKPVSPVLRNSHLHYNTEASGKHHSFVCTHILCFCVLGNFRQKIDNTTACKTSRVGLTFSKEEVYSMQRYFCVSSPHLAWLNLKNSEKKISAAGFISLLDLLVSTYYGFISPPFNFCRLTAGFADRRHEINIVIVKIDSYDRFRVALMGLSIARISQIFRCCSINQTLIHIYSVGVYNETSHIFQLK